MLLVRRFAITGLIIGLSAAAGFAAFEKGGTAYSKRLNTPLLKEPKPLAAPAGKVGFAEMLAITEVKGSWLHVKAPKAEGWVFAGNVADEKPTLPPAAGLTSVDASDTSTVAAARPLAPAATGFAERHSESDARGDIEWLDQQAATVTAAEVETFLRDNQKGEYQP